MLQFDAESVFSSNAAVQCQDSSVTQINVSWISELSFQRQISA